MHGQACQGRFVGRSMAFRTRQAAGVSTNNGGFLNSGLFQGAPAANARVLYADSTAPTENSHGPLTGSGPIFPAVSLKETKMSDIVYLALGGGGFILLAQALRLMGRM